MSWHFFQHDTTAGTDPEGARFCRCRRKESNAIHTPPEGPADDVSARILGEHNDQENEWPRGGK